MTDPTVQEFNEKVARLIKEASEADIARILGDDESLIHVMHNNNNNNSAKPQN